MTCWDKRRGEGGVMGTGNDEDTPHGPGVHLVPGFGVGGGGGGGGGLWGSGIPGFRGFWVPGAG